MAVPAIVTSIAGAASNSYVTQAEAEAYFQLQLGGAAAAWFAAAWIGPGPDTGQSDQAKALLLASKNLAKLKYVGDRFNFAQALDFPRLYPLQSADPQSIGNASVAIPNVIKEAQIVEALYLLQNAPVAGGGSEDRRALQAQGVKSFRIGQLAETYADGAIIPGGSPVGPDTRVLLKGWIKIQGGTEPRILNSQIVNSASYGNTDLGWGGYF